MIRSSTPKARHWIIPGDVIRFASGPKHNPAKPHYHFVIATTRTEVLATPVSSSEEGWNDTLIIPPPELAWLRQRSFVSLIDSRLRSRVSLDDDIAIAEQAKRQSIVWPRNEAQATVVAEIIRMMPRVVLIPEYSLRFLKRADNPERRP